MIVQICEITSVNEAVQISGVGADYVGLVVGNIGYANEVRPYKAREIILGIPKNKKSVLLVLSNNVNEIVDTIKETEPNILHISSNLEDILPDQIEQIRKSFPTLEIMRTIPVIGEESVVAAMMYDGLYDYFQLDTKDKVTGKIGTTGKTHDWQISKKIVESVKTRVILSGGLGIDNVEEAMNIVKPYGVNSKTKTDKIGINEKDLIKVKNFIEKAKSIKY